MLILPNCSLPGCAMVEILSRLPVKSLLRFKSVCKPWYSLLTSPNFITMHLQFHQTNTDKLLTESDLLLNYRWYVVPALYIYNREDNTSFDLPLHLFPFDSTSCVKIVGSCNGLVCAQGIINKNPALVLWNPATRHFKYLDPPNGTWRPSLFVEFGFVPLTNDYKVVVSRFSVRSTVYVYTLSSDSWRVKDITAPVSTGFRSRAITLNGVFYWTEHEIIVFFDLHDEVFGQMKVPPNSSFGDEIESELVVLKGSLSLIFYPKREEKDRRFEIWVMSEHGVEESWTKLCTIGPFSRIVEPVGSWKDGEIIFRFPKSRSNVMFSYDPCTQETLFFAVPEARGLIRAFNYVESLEVVDGGSKSSSKRSTLTRGDPRIQIPDENSADLKNPSNDFAWNFEIPGPKGSGLLHCRLCGQLFYRGNVTGLKQHLAHQSSFYSPCPYVSDYVKEQMWLHLQDLNENVSKQQQLGHRKTTASPLACIFADILLGKLRKLFWDLKEKLIKKRVQREKVVGNISVPHRDEFDDDDNLV